jgi:hypothetical protein
VTFKTGNRVLETSTTTGTGAYTLAGAVAGYITFGTKCLNGDGVSYYVEDVDANGVPTGGYEVCRGIWGTGGTLTRAVIEDSSNAGAAVSWAAGTRRIGLTLTARDLYSNSLGNDLAILSKLYQG